jgi:enoyl-CoA hydratase/carnithine racemase
MPIRFEAEDHIAVITIDRPNAMNALDTEHDAELERAWNRYNDQASLRCAVLVGAGDRAFCAGADLKQMIPYYRDKVRAGERPRLSLGGITSHNAAAKPLIAAVNGHALAGGTELALACDIRICSPNATFGLSETKWAIIPGSGGTQRLPRSVPLGMAMEMLLTGEPIDAETALRIGLVNRVVPQSVLLDQAKALAWAIAKRGPLAVRAARRAALESLSVGLDAGLVRESELFFEIMRTEDAVEGATAFTEKREPQYRGR